MQFVTNRISTGKAKSFEDIIKEYQESKKQVKVASSTEPVIKKAEQEEAESSGQLDVEPLHQDGESTTMPKAGPSAKKEGKDEKKSAKTNTDPEAEGKDSGQPKAEGSEKLTNDPKVLDEAKGGSAKDKTKKAALEDLPEEVQNKIKGKDSEEGETKDMCGAKHSSTDEEEEKEAETKDTEEEKEAAGMCPKCKCDPCECPEDKEAEEEEKEEKEASSVKFVKIANLNAKNKGFLREYWTKLYGEDYVNALLADK